MARCEDFPCCGHELGCCPDYDASGRQLNMKCTCGATLPINSRYSICESCMRDPDDMDELCFEDEDQDDFRDDLLPGEDMDGDWDSGMASAGFGTDEDYGDFGQNEDFGLDGGFEE